MKVEKKYKELNLCEKLSANHADGVKGVHFKDDSILDTILNSELYSKNYWRISDFTYHFNVGGVFNVDEVCYKKVSYMIDIFFRHLNGFNKYNPSYDYDGYLQNIMQLLFDDNDYYFVNNSYNEIESFTNELIGYIEEGKLINCVRDEGRFFYNVSSILNHSGVLNNDFYTTNFATLEDIKAELLRILDIFIDFLKLYQSNFVKEVNKLLHDIGYHNICSDMVFILTYNDDGKLESIKPK